MAVESEKPSISRLLSLPRQKFIDLMGPIYEKSPWVAESFCEDHLGVDSNEGNTIETVGQLASAMAAVVDAAPREKKLELLLSHPDLCEKVEKLASLTEESREEQSRAGLNALTAEEREKFLLLNREYREKFGFPFILAVRNATKYTVLSAVEGRVGNDAETEFASAISQVHKIAWMRLLTAIDVAEPKGFLTCHVLDTANGCPAASMMVRLQRLSPPESAGLVGEFVTNDDGRLPGGPALKGSDFKVGTYEWTFFVADYFSRKGNKISGTPFLDEVPIRFGIDDPDEHYHVPLLVSPWSFSTYRGS
eukprot:CAMPEP_0113549826 /NCGR_PEP_ID=MMETSP0015_2-20120614/13652_1 /TAXON_ID=2838 /ORGANISM="Odontella" /LENGTH=306 /DNA_ID=CAMNT_0000450585 /DNA_START=275 /DNA_END=1195 /DNA_ORIENTATION=- /assembly_acc=CAM_ASM_000160